ncbi:low molecular weight protein-tyrosine-phosphatase [Lysinibacter cavernae]
MPQPEASIDSAFRVCFVCTGNICRSPMAEVVFRHLAEQAGLGENIIVSSRGTGDWHVGERADSRTLAALTARGYGGSEHRAHEMDTVDFRTNDLIIALDRTHLRVLSSLAPSPEDLSKIELLQTFVGSSDDALDVPDPYYADDLAFAQVLATIEKSCAALFNQLEPAIRRKR